jgi:hypothetical protein
VFIINIFEKVPNIFALTKLFLADKGFYVYKIDRYLLKTMPGGHKDKETGKMIIRSREKGSNFEPVWVAKHFSQLYKEGLITKEQAIQFRDRATLDKKESVVSI